MSESSESSLKALTQSTVSSGISIGRSALPGLSAQSPNLGEPNERDRPAKIGPRCVEHDTCQQIKHEKKKGEESRKLQA
ncbi:hypothetical protein COLO4_26554 [Corchorus olitorius]|uniref:Uncharacterized protein n=1 Tax=Corchorus olitorius TaxID=93759 RepID=A0A1R3HWE6_9ROSI|nr:hypothetical protein COLO4_26554 [Corchorus olitorius]